MRMDGPGSRRCGAGVELLVVGCLGGPHMMHLRWELHNSSSSSLEIDNRSNLGMTDGRSGRRGAYLS